VTPEALAAELGISGKTLRSWLRARFPRPTLEKGSDWSLTDEQVETARAWRASAGRATSTLSGRPAPARRGRARSESDAGYVLDLCDELLEERGSREHTFPWLLGDPGKTSARRQLPVDAYYVGHGLVIEYRERQHDEPVAFFDKPERMTVSGVHRGEQRRRYDERRDREIPAHGLRLLVIKPSDLDEDRRGRLHRTRDTDRRALKAILAPARGRERTPGP